MAYREVGSGNTIDIKKEKDKSYEGVYQGFKEITTDIGQQFIYKFKDGMTYFGIYGFTTLNMAMESIAVNAQCRITYLGTKNMKTKYGMKDVHTCRVEVDDDVPVRDLTDEYGEPLNQSDLPPDEETDIVPF